MDSLVQPHDQSGAFAALPESVKTSNQASVNQDRLIGKVIDDRYVVSDLVKTGGMGSVYKAKHRTLGKIKAIKVLKHSSLCDDHALNRFSNEAKAASTLDHPNLVAVHDFGLTGDGEPYLVMDYVDGDSLAEILRREGALNAHVVIAYLLQICDGLDYAHTMGIIHRDIKPSNIVVANHTSGPGLIKILDFGIAKNNSADPNQQQITRTGEIFGSPLYMSPEQCHGNKALDERSDIYSLGCVIYEALSGVPPFLGSSCMQTMYKHIHEPALRLRLPRCSAEIANGMADLVARCLQKRPSQRYQSMKDLRADLLAIQRRDSRSKLNEKVEVTWLDALKTHFKSGFKRRSLIAVISTILVAFCAWWVWKQDLFVPDWQKELDAASSSESAKQYSESTAHLAKAVTIVDAAHADPAQKAYVHWKYGEYLFKHNTSGQNPNKIIKALHLYADSANLLAPCNGNVTTAFRARCIARQGDCQFLLNSYPKAIFCYREALTLYKSVNQLANESQLCYAAGQAYEKISRFADAENSYRQALNSAKRASPFGKINSVPAAAFGLARCMEKQNNLRDADKQFSIAEKLRIAATGKQDPRLGPVYVEHLALLRSLLQSHSPKLTASEVRRVKNQINSYEIKAKEAIELQT